MLSKDKIHSESLVRVLRSISICDIFWKEGDRYHRKATFILNVDLVFCILHESL